VLALGGYWLIEPVVALAREGHCFDETLPDEYWVRLRRRLIDGGHWDGVFLGEKGADQPFALDMVQSDIPADFLYQQYQEARSGVDGGYCLGTQDGRGRCLGCGACVDGAQRATITQTRSPLPDEAATLSRLREVVVRKQRLQPIPYVLRFDGLEAGLHPAALNALVFQAILDRCPALIDNLLAVRENLFTVAPGKRGKGSKRGRYPTMGGESVFALTAWDAAALQHALLEIGDAGSDRFGAVGPAEEFVPGTFTSCHLEMHLPEVHFAQARRQLDQYLHDAYVPYSLRREDPLAPGGSRYRFDVPKKGQKKKVLLGGVFETGEAGLDASLDVGLRFDLLAFLERFGPSYHVPYATLRVSRIRW
jgi:hypothetical protein